MPTLRGCARWGWGRTWRVERLRQRQPGLGGKASELDTLGDAGSHRLSDPPAGRDAGLDLDLAGAAHQPHHRRPVHRPTFHGDLTQRHRHRVAARHRFSRLCTALELEAQQRASRDHCIRQAADRQPRVRPRFTRRERAGRQPRQQITAGGGEIRHLRDFVGNEWPCDLRVPARAVQHAAIAAADQAVRVGTDLGVTGAPHQCERVEPCLQQYPAAVARAEAPDAGTLGRRLEGAGAGLSLDVAVGGFGVPRAVELRRGVGGTLGVQRPGQAQRETARPERRPGLRSGYASPMKGYR